VIASNPLALKIIPKEMVKHGANSLFFETKFKVKQELFSSTNPDFSGRKG
jgi:hypothetical protein